MRILCVNCIFSEFGGVEFAAINLGEALAKRGHSVHFLSAAGTQSPLKPQSSASYSGTLIKSHTRRFPRIYPLGEKHGTLKKLAWHLQDLAHPENERQFSAVLAEVKPDICLLHTITAIGLNIWRPLAAMNVPTVQVIHDLGLVCMNMSRFRGGQPCKGLCMPCRAQKILRFAIIDGKPNFSFVSPSRAMLDMIGEYADLDQWESAVIPNANSFVVEPRRVTQGAPANILYVGRVDPSKGIDVALRAARRAAEQEQFVFNVLGTGSIEQSLREEFAGCGWAKFHGNVSQEKIAELMAESSVLVVPSLWPENAPSVAVHALHARLPVIGSRIGGIPEHVFDEVTGCLVTPGNVEAWRAALVRAIKSPDLVQSWSDACSEKSALFSAAAAADAYEKFMLRQLEKRDRRLGSQVVAAADRQNAAT